MATTFLIVVNPTAGRGKAARLAEALARLLQQGGAECRLEHTAAPGAAESIAKRALGDSTGPLCVVACGGDGTVQEVANAVAKAGADRATLGIAPAGRCNDFARAMGITANPSNVASVLTTGEVRPVDLGRIDDRYFCTVAAMGFDAAVSRYVDRSKVPLRGTLAYVHGTLRVLLGFKTPVLRLSGDFGEYEGPVFLAASANTAWYGGAMNIAPDADPFDGRIDICLVTDIAKWRVLKLMPQVMSGRHARRPEVRLWRTRDMTASTIDGGSDLEVWADGEPIARLPATIESVPAAIRIVLPSPASAESSP